MSQDSEYIHNLAAVLLVLGTTTFIGSLFILFLRADFQAIVSGQLQRALGAVAEHVTLFRWSYVGATGGVVLSTLGLVTLTTLLLKAGDSVLSVLALILFLLAALLWIVEHSIHLSMTVWAAGETSRTSLVPDSYEPMYQLAETVERIYTVLAFTSVAIYGWALLKTGLLPSWVGWVSIGWSGLGLIVFLTNLNSIPALLLIMPFVMGIVLLVR